MLNKLSFLIGRPSLGKDGLSSREEEKLFSKYEQERGLSEKLPGLSFMFAGKFNNLEFGFSLPLKVKFIIQDKDDISDFFDENTKKEITKVIDLVWKKFKSENMDSKFLGEEFIRPYLKIEPDIEPKDIKVEISGNSLGLIVALAAYSIFSGKSPGYRVYATGAFDHEGATVPVTSIKKKLEIFSEKHLIRKIPNILFAFPEANNSEITDDEKNLNDLNIRRVSVKDIDQLIDEVFEIDTPRYKLSPYFDICFHKLVEIEKDHYQGNSSRKHNKMFERIILQNKIIEIRINYSYAQNLRHQGKPNEASHYFEKVENQIEEIGWDNIAFSKLDLLSHHFLTIVDTFRSKEENLELANKIENEYFSKNSISVRDKFHFTGSAILAYRAGGNFKKAYGLRKMIIDEANYFSNVDNNIKLEMARSYGYASLECYQDSGSVSDSQKYFEQGLELLDNLPVDAFGENSIENQLSWNIFYMAKVYFNSGNYEKCLSTLDKLNNYDSLYILIKIWFLIMSAASKSYLSGEFSDNFYNLRDYLNKKEILAELNGSELLKRITDWRYFEESRFLASINNNDYIEIFKKGLDNFSQSKNMANFYKDEIEKINNNIKNPSDFIKAVDNFRLVFLY